MLIDENTLHILKMYNWSVDIWMSDQDYNQDDEHGWLPPPKSFFVIPLPGVRADQSLLSPQISLHFLEFYGNIHIV